MKTNKGQALVETAIIAPLLIFLLIGVFEVGWAMRSYLVLANANREAARFAVRTDSLNFDGGNIGYEEVYTHAVNSISGQVDFTTRGEMLINRIWIDAGVVCNGSNCDCLLARTSPATPTLLMTAFVYPTLTARFPATSTRQSIVVNAELITSLVEQARQHNCELISKGILPQTDDVIVVEMWLEHPQLFGFPVISNPLTDPIELYGHTTMRRIQDTRSK